MVRRHDTYRVMKIIIALLFCNFVVAANADDQIRLVRNGTNVTEQPSAALTTNIVKLLQSCSYNSTAYAGKAENWRDIEHFDSFVHLTFGAPQRLVVTIYTNDPAQLSRGTTAVKSIDELLVPLPVGGAGPRHIFARSGTNILSFCKWDPFALKMVAFEPALHLSSVYPYSAYAQFKPPNK
jgi:hypothetical protein